MKKIKTKITLLAFSKGEAEGASVERKKYIGVAKMSIVSINPKKEEYEKLLNTKLDNEINYLSTVDRNGEQVKQLRLAVIMHADAADNNGLKFNVPVNFFIRDEFSYNKEKTKIQVIDRYGRTAWVTQKQLTDRVVPTYNDGRKMIDEYYRPIYSGEDEVTNFFRVFLQIPSVEIYKDGKWVETENKDKSEARFDNINKAFTGDISEFLAAWNSQKNNKVKAMLGIRSSNNKEYQTAYTRMFLRSYGKIETLKKDLERQLSIGRYPTTKFSLEPVREYVVEATELSTPKVEGENPFGSPENNIFFK